MKHSLLRFRRGGLAGFTLVELLVVIGIIAILAAVLATVGNNAIKAALRAKAQNTAVQIQASVLQYYTEYNAYPIATSGSDVVITDASASSTSWGNLICALSGNINPSTGTMVATTGSITNTRSITFLTLKASDVDTKGAPLNPIPNSTSNPYFNIAIDGDYDGILGVSSYSNTMPNFTTGSFSATGGGTSTAGVALWANCNPTTLTNASYYIHTY